VDRNIAVAPLYMVLTPVRILTYHILTTILYRRISVGHTAVPPPYYVYIPIRVGIHICVYTQETGVWYHTKLLRLYTIDLVYTYIMKYICGKKHKMSKIQNFFLLKIFTVDEFFKHFYGFIPRN
jgi:hypothetical protein